MKEYQESDFLMVKSGCPQATDKQIFYQISSQPKQFENASVEQETNVINCNLDIWKNAIKEYKKLSKDCGCSYINQLLNYLKKSIETGVDFAPSKVLITNCKIQLYSLLNKNNYSVSDFSKKFPNLSILVPII